MIEIESRIKHAAVDDTLRAAASALWKRHALTLFDPHDERNGLRVSDAGQCVRKLYNLVNGTIVDTFSPEVQLDNLDNGTMVGCWRACLLAASLEADGFVVEMEPTVEHDGTPGHIDLYFHEPEWTKDLGEAAVIEFKSTNWTGALDHPEKSKRYQILQAAKYAAAKGCDDFAIVTVGPAARGAKMRVDWFSLGDWQHAVIGEWLRLSAALGPVEPDGDPDFAWRCKGCAVEWCDKNPEYAATDELLVKRLEASVNARI